MGCGGRRKAKLVGVSLWDTCIGKVQRQIRRFLCSLYQKPTYLSISSTVPLKNVRGRFAPHLGAQTRRKSGVTSILRSKISAQGRFTRPEQVQSPKGERPKGANPQSRLLAAVPSGTSIRSAAQNCHRRNSFPPLNDKIGTEVCIAHRSPKSPEVRRLKRFATQNLGAGGIYFRRASAITEGRSTPQGCGVQKRHDPGSCLFLVE